MSQLSLISLKVLVTPLNTYIDIEQRIHSYRESVMIPGPLLLLWKLKPSVGLLSTNRPSGKFSGELATRLFL